MFVTLILNYIASMFGDNFKCVVCIPARINSTRLNGKVLLDLDGKAIVHHVYDKAMQVKGIADVIILTDSEVVMAYCNHNGLRAMMTAMHHESGTDRCAEAASKLKDVTHIINLQGDEPFIDPDNISRVAAMLYHGNPIASLCALMSDAQDIIHPSKVKVVLDDQGRALYFSRSPIPYLRDIEPREWPNYECHFLHIGIYGFKKEVLLELANLPSGRLETLEKLEQLRWLENGYGIHISKTSMPSFGIDTPEDYEKAVSLVQAGRLKL